MKSFKFYISIALIIGLYLSVNSSSFAGEQYSIDIQNLKNAVKQNFWDENAEITWKASVRNNTDKAQTYNVTVDFLNSNKNIIGKETRTTKVGAKKTKTVTYKLNFSSSELKEIDSGYVVITKAEDVIDNKTQTLTAKVENKIIKSKRYFSDQSVELAYSVKLRNNTGKSISKGITVSFLDENSNLIASETRKTSFFNAGEAKIISDKIKLSASDANKIATGHVTIN